MSNFMSSDHVLLDVECATKEAALELLSDKALELGITEDRDGVLAAFKQRELEGPTGMMSGFAVPHAKSAVIKDASVIVLRFTEGIAAWESIDGQPIDLAIALLVPDAEAGTTHLKLLAQIARALMDEDFMAALRSAESSAAVSDLVNSKLVEE